MGAERRRPGRRQKGTGTIIKRTKVRADGSKYTYYEGRYEAGRDMRTNKRVQRSVTGKTEKEVKEKIEKLAAMRRVGMLPDPTGITVRDWINTWMESYSKASPRCRELYRSYLRLYMTEELFDKPLQKVTVGDASAWAKQLTQPKESNGYGLAPKTARNVVMFMKSVFGEAEEEHILTRNPFRTVAAPDVKNSEEDYEPPVNEEELRSLLELLTGAPHEDFYRFSIFFGLREMENLGLTMDDIDMEKRVIHLRYQLRKDPRPEDVLPGETLHFKALKDKEKRTIPFGEEVAKILQRQIDSERQKKARLGAAWPGRDVLELGDLLFSNNRGSYLSYRTIYDCFKRRVRTVPKLEKLRVHDLRHVYAMLALSAGNSMDAVADHLGHASADFTRKVYAYFAREKKQRDAAAMDELIRGIT